MELIVLIISLISLVISTCVLCLVALILYKVINEDVSILPNFPLPTPKEGAPSQDAYTPNETDQLENLGDFEPDHTKPIKVTVKDEAGNGQDFTTGEGEKMTPVETDDVFEEDIDAKA